MSRKSNRKVAQVEAIQDVEAVENSSAEVTEIVASKETKVEALVLNEEQQVVYNDLKTKSAKIRYLHGEKFSRSQIANYLGIRYQHVRNVLTTELKRTVTV